MKKRYSKYIVPISIIAHLAIINGAIALVSDQNFYAPEFIIYINFIWLLIAYYTNYYKFNRNSKLLRIISQIVFQFSAFTIAYFAFFGIFKEGEIVDNQLKLLQIIFFGISSFQILYFYFFKLYRKGGLNFRNVVVIGSNPTSEKITELFNVRGDFGYRYKGFFSDKSINSVYYLGKIDHSYNYILSNEIDEIYCTLSTLSNKQIKKYKDLADSNDLKINFIPDSKELHNKQFVVEYYDTIPVLKIKELPFERLETKIIKRILDIVLSVFILFFILLWLTPILWILIKLESNGPLFFKQVRRGLDGENFVCYKFRSMKNDRGFDETRAATKDDERVTKIGMFIRKTSIDELPQFYNVLKGDMSVVGPRPHMRKQSLKFEREIENYFARNSIKPGITGLAQTRGYRGEIINRSDIENRVRLDIFYIENWSFLLDIKIILQTVLNALIGEEKAY